MYSLIVSYTIDWVPSSKVTGAAATLIGINGSGAFVGPLVAAPLMSIFGPRWFFWCITAAFGVVAGYVAWRLLFREAMPQEHQQQFVPFPARAGYLAMAMMVEPVRRASRVATGKHVTMRRHLAGDIERQAGGSPSESAASPTEIPHPDEDGP